MNCVPVIPVVVAFKVSVTVPGAAGTGAASVAASALCILHVTAISGIKHRSY